MSTNEVSKPAESGQSAAAPEQTLSLDIFDTMIQKFKEKQCPIADATTDTKSTPEKVDSNENSKEAIKVSELMKANAKQGDYKHLVAAVNAADGAIAANPRLNEHIEKLELQSMHLHKQSWQQEAHIRETAQNTFSKAEMQKLSALGPNPLDNFGKKISFDFNNAQRAWLKENHLDVYKLLQKHDQTSLERTNTNATLRELGDTREGPINTRIDLARYQHTNGMGPEAIRTLTETINTRPSIVTRETKGDEFRLLAAHAGAAWDPAFRNAVEHSGGNILNFVTRPHQLREFKSSPKPIIDFNPENLNK